MQATPVGFEPTRGDPIGLAGRRLNHSAKVSMVACLGTAHLPTPCERRHSAVQDNSKSLVTATQSYAETRDTFRSSV